MKQNDFTQNDGRSIQFKLWKTQQSMKLDYYLNLFFIMMFIGLSSTVLFYFLFPSQFFYHIDFFNVIKYLYGTDAITLRNGMDLTLKYNGEELAVDENTLHTLSVEVYAGFIKLGLIFFGGATAGLMLGKKFLEKLTDNFASDMIKDKHIRGAKVIDEKALQAIQKEKKITGINLCQNVDNLKVILDYTQETKHILMYGSTGVGKSVIMKRAYVQWKQDGHRKFIIHDTKGDWIRQFYNQETDYILNPLDARSINFEIQSALKYIPDIDTVCAALIPDSNKGEPFWVNSARDMLKGIIKALQYKQGMNFKNIDVKRMISLPIAKLAKELKDVPGAEMAYGYIADPTSTQANNIYGSFRTYMSFFLNLEEDGKKGFDIEEFLTRKEGGTLFLANFAKYQAFLSPIISLFIDTIAREVLDLEESNDRRIHFMLDEFGQLQKLDGIIKLLTVARSNGVSVWIGIQEEANMREKYGDNLTDTIANNTPTKIMMSVGDPNTRKKISDMIGERQYEYTTQNYSTGIEADRDGSSFNKSKVIEKAVLPSEIGLLQEHQFYFNQRGIDWVLVSKNKFVPENDIRENKTEKLVMKSNFIISYPNIVVLNNKENTPDAIALNDIDKRTASDKLLEDFVMSSNKEQVVADVKSGKYDYLDGVDDSFFEKM